MRQVVVLIEYYSSLAAKGGDNAPRYVVVNGVGAMADIRAQIVKGLDA